MKKLSILAMAALMILAVMALPALAAEVPAGAIKLVDDGGVWLYWIPGANGGEVFHSNSTIAQASGQASAVVPGYIRLTINESSVQAGPDDDYQWMGLEPTTYDVPAPVTAAEDYAPASQDFNVEVKSNSGYYMVGYGTYLFKDLSGWEWPPVPGAKSIKVEGTVDGVNWFDNGPAWIWRSEPTFGDTFTYRFRARTGWLTEKGSYGGQICFQAFQP